MPPGRLSHRAGYVIDAGEEEPEVGKDRTPQVAGDGLLQHQDSPSRLGVAIDYDVGPAGGFKKPNPLSSSSEADYYDYDYAVPTAAANKTGAPPPYGVNLGDLNDSDEQSAAARPLPDVSSSAEQELEGFGAVFPELVSNGIRRKSSSTGRPPHGFRRPTPGAGEVHHTVVDQAIDSYDKKFGMVEVDSAERPLNTTTFPDHEGANLSGGSGLTYLLIGVLGGLSLLFFCAVGLTIRCRKRRFRFTTFASLIGRGGGVTMDEEASSTAGGSPTPNSVAARRIANQQHIAGKEAAASEVSTHKLGSWFTGRNSMSSLHSHTATGTASRKVRGEMALPSALSTVGTATGKRIVTRAYFTDGRTGSTRDLVTSGASSESSGSHPGTPALVHPPPDRKSWLHSSYTKDRGNSLSELRDSSFYCITSAALPASSVDGGTASSDEGERPRSASATVRSPVHHFRNSQSRLEDSLEPPPDLPPKRRASHHAGGLDSVIVDPMGSHLTLQSEVDCAARSDVAVSYWGSPAGGSASVEDRLI